MSDLASAPTTPAEPTAPVTAEVPAVTADASVTQQADTPAPDSLAEHEASLGRERDDKTGQYRHRSQKQKARAEDVPRIQELTKNWRTTEERALKAEKELAEIRETLKPKATGPQLRQVPKVEASTFEKPEPKLEQFASAEDPYLAFVEARQDWRLEKREHDQKQASAKTEAESATTHNQTQMRQFFHEKSRDFGGRLNALLQRDPEAQKTFEAVQQLPLTDNMHAAIMLDPKGEELMLHIAKNIQSLQGELDELFMLTDERTVTPAYVALVQRRMHRWMQAAQSTGSAAPAPQKVAVAPRPPSPVRTGAMKTADTPPGDEGTLADHESYFGKRR